MNQETWRQVVGFEGTYEVSDLGRVRSLPRTRTQSFVCGRLPVYERVIQATPGVVLSPKTKPNGYLEVNLQVAGRSCMRYVHRLVLESFVGAPPEPNYQAGHLNGKRTDNRLANLAWVTPLVNISHKKGHGTHKPSRSPKALLKRRAASVLRDNGFSAEEIAMCLSIRVTTVEKLAR